VAIIAARWECIRAGGADGLRRDGSDGFGWVHAEPALAGHDGAPVGHVREGGDGGQGIDGVGSGGARVDGEHLAAVAAVLREHGR
jgi:hypothetical protein